jgi:hypothetical protein
VLDAAARRFDFKLDWEVIDWGGDRYCAPARCSRTPRRPSSGRRRDPARRHRPPRRQAGILEKGILLRLRFELQQYINLRPGQALPGRLDPAQGQGTGAHRFRGGAREQRGSLHRGRRLLKHGTPEEIAIQTSDPVARRRGPLPQVRLRADARARPGQDPDPGGQDQRPHLRVRPLGARLPRDGPRDYPTSSANTTTSTPAACGSSRTPSGTT